MANTDNPIGSMFDDADHQLEVAKEYLTGESKYFCDLSSADIGTEVLSRVETFRNTIQQNGMLDSWTTRINYYNGNYQNNNNRVQYGIKRSGEEGNLTILNINEFRSILESIVALSTVNPPVIDIESVNSDSTSNRLSVLCKILIDYYMDHKNLKQCYMRGMEEAVIWDQAYCMTLWDTSKGRDYGPAASGQSGDIQITNPLPCDVIFDTTRQSWDDLDWIIVEDVLPKVQLCQQYSMLADRIDAAGIYKSSQISTFRRAVSLNNLSERDNTENVSLFRLFHRKTSFKPDGRYTEILGDGTVLVDVNLPYDNMPISRVVTKERLGTVFGRSASLDLIAPQEQLTVLNSTIASNQRGFGLHYIAMPAGSKVSPETLDGNGFIIVEYDNDNGHGRPPEGLNLSVPAPELREERDTLIKMMQTQVGVSATSRGQPEPDSSGTAMAMAASLTAQSQGPYLVNAATFLSDIATNVIRILRRYANNPVTWAIMGIHAAGKQEFADIDMMDFDRVVAKSGNPLTSTYAGRLELANQLLTMSMIDANGYITLLYTGNLQPVFEGPEQEADWIRTENELLMQNVDCLVLDTDNHQKHEQEHRTLTFDKDIRGDTSPAGRAKLMNILRHINEHQRLMAGVPAPQGAPAGPPHAGAPGPGPHPSGPPQGGPPPGQPPGPPMTPPVPQLGIHDPNAPNVPTSMMPPGMPQPSGQPNSVSNGASPMLAPANAQAIAAGVKMPLAAQLPKTPTVGAPR